MANETRSCTCDNDEREDRQELRELVENWALWRDAGDWDRFASVWDPAEGWMSATWFQGPAAEFIAVSGTDSTVE